MIQKIELPYRLDALEPYYSAETLNIHYNTLYKGYVDNYNKVQEELKNAREKNDFTNIKCLEKNLSFQGSGVILHELFFTNMKPQMRNSAVVGGESLYNQIVRDFGSFNSFKNQFNEASKAVEASGWGILAWVPRFNKLEILQCEKHQDLTLWGCTPILVIDMWEHSYFLQYKANRGEYINAFWNIINWETANNRFEYAINKK